MPLKFANNQSLTSTTSLPAAVPTDNLILISTQTASNSASISFTSGLDSTYDMYEFHFLDIHPSTGGTNNFFQFNFSTDGGSNYNVTKTTTAFDAYLDEAGTGGILEYDGNGIDLAQSTSYQKLHVYRLSDAVADESMAGVMQIFNPSSTTYVKHFISRTNNSNAGTYCVQTFVAGYGNTTSAINAILFNSSTAGNFNGTIKLYGVKKS